MNGPTPDAANEDDVRRIRIAAALILLHTVPMILLMPYIYVNAPELADMSPFRPLITGYFTVETMITFMRLAAAATIIGGALGIVSAFLAIKRRRWKATVALCLISAAAGIFSFAGLVMGLAAFWLLLKAKPAFAD
ncbi:MAG: hypothetical protein LBH69_02315 [Methanomassiliicoccaceae archaeon]|jgi:hypothetical protein|nr:hypothetical protein [Methanomassiliicoccaceae archaeon]